MVQYRLDLIKLKKLLRQKGFQHISQFASAHRINRATLNNYIRQGPFSEAFYKLSSAVGADPLALLSPYAPEKPIGNGEEIIPLANQLVQNCSELAVGLLGSRAKGAPRPYSDWDLGVTASQKKMSSIDFLRLRQKVSDLAEDLPRSVDLINLDQSPLWFLKGIDYEPVFLLGNEASWNYFLGVLHGAKKAA